MASNSFGIKSGLIFYREKLNQLAASKFAGWFLLSILFFIVAAAAHSGFIAKWSFRDATNFADNKRYSFEAMMDGTADKPFVYRQLAPALANAADFALPPAFKDYVVRKFNPSETYQRTSSANLPSYAFRYRLIFFLHFLSLFFSLFLLRSVVMAVGVDEIEATFAASAFVLAFPYLQTVGGYFYDGAELMFLSAVVLATLRGQYAILLVLSAIATYNKESFFFYIPTLYPLIRFHLNKKRTMAVLFSAMSVSGLVNILVKITFAGNGGGTAEIHLLQNFKNYLQPWFYRQLEVTYGMPGPQGAFLLTLIVALLITVRGWPCTSKSFRTHTTLCFLINFPLFIVFCATGELRNLSFLYVEFVVFLGFAMKLYSSDRSPRQSSFNPRP